MKKLYIVLMLACTACSSAPLKNSSPPDPNPHSISDLDGDKRVVLPHQMNQYLDHLDWLVGMVCFTIPHDNSCANATLKCSMRALDESKDICRSPEIKRLGRTILNTKFEGKAAANVSFLAGAIDINDDRLIEAIVQEDSQAQVKPDTGCVDRGEIKKLVDIPDKWCNAVWESSITSHVISYRQYEKFVGDVGAGVAAITAGSSSYVSNDSLSVANYLTGYAILIDDLVPCNRDQITGICTKKNIAQYSSGARAIASSEATTADLPGTSTGSRTLSDSEVKALSRASVRTNDQQQAVFSSALKDELTNLKMESLEKTKEPKRKKLNKSKTKKTDNVNQ